MPTNSFRIHIMDRNSPLDIVYYLTFEWWFTSSTQSLNFKCPRILSPISSLQSQKSSLILQISSKKSHLQSSNFKLHTSKLHSNSSPSSSSSSSNSSLQLHFNLLHSHHLHLLRIALKSKVSINFTKITAETQNK